MGVVRLNLGAGAAEQFLDGYANLDAKYGHTVYPLLQYYRLKDGITISTEDVDEIRASHVLEHFPHNDTPEVVRDWVSHLRPGGVLKVAVPDVELIARAMAAGNPEGWPIASYLYGGQTDERDFHKAAFNESRLRKIMEDAGLTDIRRWGSGHPDCATLPISLNLQGVKPLADGSIPISPEELRIVESVRQGRVYLPERIEGVRAAIAMPRLSFTHSNFDMMKALVPLGIPVAKLCGIWWGQQLTPLIEKHLEAGDCKYILTIDYDSRFSKADVQELYRLMEEHPEADAIAPIQIRRGSTTPLFTIRDPFTGRNKCAIPESELQKELLRVHTAHFGLTMLRVSALRDLPKPWFQNLPDNEGRWSVDKGCVQEDIFFWRRWEDNGRTLYVAPHVRIGHGCEAVLMPDDNLHGVMVELDEYERIRDERDKAMEAQS